MVNADATGLGGDVGDFFGVGPQLRVLTTSCENAVFDVVLQAQFVTAFDHLHAAVFGRGIVKHDHHGHQVCVGVGKEGEVLVPSKGAFAFGGWFGGEFGVLQLNVWANERFDAVDDAWVFGQCQKGRVARGQAEQVNGGVFEVAFFNFFNNGRACAAWRKSSTSFGEKTSSMTKKPSSLNCASSVLDNCGVVDMAFSKAYVLSGDCRRFCICLDKGNL